MTVQQDPINYKALSIEELEALAHDDPNAAYELYQRELDDSYPDCEPEKNICYCGFCLDPNDEDEDDYQPTQVWFTEAPGGHNGWE